MQMMLRILKTTLLATLVLAALACNGDNGPTPTATPSERVVTDPPPATGTGGVPTAKGWRTRAPMPTPRSEVAVAAVGGKIYVVGGFERDGSTSDAVEVYNPATDTWTQAPPLPEPRHHAAAATRFLFDGETGEYRVLVIGGYEAGFDDPTDTVFEFSEASGTWTELAPMPTARGGHAVAEYFGGKIYAIGGADADGENVASVEVYDPPQDSWSSGGELETPRDHLAAALASVCAGDVCAQGLYAIGGRSNIDFGRNLDAVEMYAPQTDTWIAKAPLPTARSGIAAVQFNGLIYVFGGEGPEGTFDEVEVYDQETDTWSAVSAMPTARHGLGAAVVGDSIYVIGGGETPGLSVSGANEAFTP